MSFPDDRAVTDGLLTVLDLRSVPSGVDDSPIPHSPAADAFRCFEGDSHPHPGGHVFGGQVMGQAVMAVGRTVPEGRHIHSMFSYFLRPGDPSVPIRFEVDSLRDGRSFSVRRVLAIQHEKTILAMTASFQEEQDGLEHAEPMPEAPDPETLPTTADHLRDIDHPVAQYWATQRPIDIRHVERPIYLAPDESGRSQQMVWMKVLAPVEADQLTHDAILSFASDYTPFEPILRRQGLAWTTPGIRAATINHAIWWHSRPDVNEWMLFVQRSPSAAGGRGLTEGLLYRRSGELIATVTQEGMIRIKE
ncbi:acyl-CoA thioesterase II [Helcobacillus massiliensis]|uniref:acyl-CoA thioesterase n=1 Tax=Helcobacillus massiliensis TaxID=521392 RepID=UPI0021A80BBB|nr:acyl-CoA thioesterase II [Helcobacillus massiliensis]MCT1558461.1 acyl-CoA thioesterase II [Helcobacillus massiliensis]MCT2037150.1 acyl-CoA thioesterase II [Helcobacillus massiliensis]MCT2332086.1 acyl-CoA thioesterase II [Helcobacillus massiliensis]